MFYRVRAMKTLKILVFNDFGEIMPFFVILGNHIFIRCKGKFEVNCRLIVILYVDIIDYRLKNIICKNYRTVF